MVQITQPPPPPPPPNGAPSGADKVTNPDPATAMPSRNPLPLSASQEAAVRDVFYARVRRHCADEIKAFADCALGRTFTVPFACSGPHRAMNGCMKARATPAEHDAAREEWFAGRLGRAREREQKARRKAEQERFLREWWKLPERAWTDDERRAAEGRLRHAADDDHNHNYNHNHDDDAAAAAAAAKGR